MTGVLLICCDPENVLKDPDPPQDDNLLQILDDQ